MKKINIAKNITDLRKKKGVTQEQMASALNISSQAVSKWETNSCQPDILTLPLIADYFDVSIDYLFYGQDIVYDEIYEKIYQKICSYPQMSKESYDAALTTFGYSHHGITRGNLRSRDAAIHEEPAHISNKNGISLLSGKGYGAIITRAFFENVNKDTADFATTFLPLLSDKKQLLVCMTILSMSDISFEEIKEKLNFNDEELRKALDILVTSKLVVEKKSKHKALGYTYEINNMYHTCLCILIATIEMQRFTLSGISCCMGFGDYPIKF